MASAKSVITLALSKLGVSGAGKAPRQSDLDLGITTLQALYRYLISSGALGRARPVTPVDHYTARENDRIFRTAEHATLFQIDLPDIVTDTYAGCSDSIYYDDPQCSGPRPPREGAFVIINDANTGNTAEYIYEGYTNRWISVHDLSLQEREEVRDANGGILAVKPESVAPLSYRDMNGLAALLATKLADHYSATPSALTIRDALNWQAALANGFGEPERELFNDLVWTGRGSRY